MEKAMATHSSTLAWKIPWAEEPGRLPSMGSLRGGHDWSDFTFTFHFHALEKKMATHSSVLAWRIPGMWGPVGLPSMGSPRVKHNWSDLPNLTLPYAKPLLTTLSQLFLAVGRNYCLPSYEGEYRYLQCVLGLPSLCIFHNSWNIEPENDTF